MSRVCKEPSQPSKKTNKKIKKQAKDLSKNFSREKKQMSNEHKKRGSGERKTKTFGYMNYAVTKGCLLQGSSYLSLEASSSQRQQRRLAGAGPWEFFRQSSSGQKWRSWGHGSGDGCATVWVCVIQHNCALNSGLVISLLPSARAKGLEPTWWLTSEVGGRVWSWKLLLGRQTVRSLEKMLIRLLVKSGEAETVQRAHGAESHHSTQVRRECAASDGNLLLRKPDFGFWLPSLICAPGNRSH